MDFSSTKTREDHVKYHESGPDSSIHLIFIPGMFNRKIWRHQIKYFSGNFRTVSFDTEINEFGFQKNALEKYLERDDVENVVLISQGLSNTLAQEFEYREEVIATVLTGAVKTPRNYPRAPYRATTKILEKPKIFKKMFFSETCNYRIVKQFLKDSEIPSYETYYSFANKHALRRPIKNSMIIYAENDPVSSLKEAKRLKPETSISMIEDAGTFCFYEKPQEYNKALLDFLGNLEEFVESRKESKTRKQNKSIKDFIEVKN